MLLHVYTSFPARPLCLPLCMHYRQSIKLLFSVTTLLTYTCVKNIYIYIYVCLHHCQYYTIQYGLYEFQPSRKTTSNRQLCPYTVNLCSIYYNNTVLSRKYVPLRDNTPSPPPPPPTVWMKSTAQVSLSVKTLTVTSNLYDVYKILYYAAVLCSWSFLLTCYHKSFLSTISIFNCGTWLCSTSYNYYSARI